MTFFAFLATGISFLAIILVYKTLRATRDAGTTTERVGEAQSQAYVHVESAKFYWGSRELSAPRIILSIKNTGHTPARWFSIESEIVLGNLDPVGRLIDEHPFTNRQPRNGESVRWNALGPNSELTVPASHFTTEISADLRRRRKQVALSVIGTVRYETFFGKVFETEFWFMSRDLRGFKGDHTPDPIGGGIVRVIAPEAPQKLTRGSGILRSYRLIGKSTDS